MSLFSSFIRIEITSEMQGEARYHALRRTKNIKRQFIPRHAPLSALESNYIGSLGEITVLNLVHESISLTDNYAKHKVDDGDIRIQDSVFDIKSEALPYQSYKKLYDGSILAYETYGCRVYTARHSHHLQKYSGGIIFVAFPIPDDTKEDKNENRLREQIVEFCNPGLILGYAPLSAFEKKIPQHFAPADPESGKRHRYNSENFVFHHSELQPLSLLLKE